MEHSYVSKDTGKLSFAEIRAIFTRVYPKPNMMTPNILDYIDAGKYIVEVSGGRGFDNDPIFGVTVLGIKGNKHHDLNKLFHNYAKAITYVSTLDKE